MASPPITPNMNLTEPIVGSTVSPTWATDLNADLTIIDQHNHTPGNGVQIPTAGLDINSDLSFNYNNLLGLNSLVFAGAISGTASPLSLYSDGTNLFYEDSAGYTIQLTKNHQPNAGTGNIQGLPSTPMGGAGISWVNSQNTFDFLSDAGTVGANISGGALELNYTSTLPTAGSKSVILQVPSSVSSYSLTLPTALPSKTNFLTLDTSGNIAAVANVDGSTLQFVSNTLSVAAQGITSTQIANNTITTSQISATAGIVNSQLAAVPLSSTTITNVSTSSTSGITIGTIYITTNAAPTNRPILIGCQGNGSTGNPSYFQASVNPGYTEDLQIYGYVRIINQTTGQVWLYPFTAPGGSEEYDPSSVQFPASCFTVYDFYPTLANTTYTYALQIISPGTSGGTTVTVAAYNIQFFAVQL